MYMNQNIHMNHVCVIGTLESVSECLQLSAQLNARINFRFSKASHF